MKFILYGEIKFSKNIGEAEEELKKIIENANETILLKGVPEGQEDYGAKITDWNINDDMLNITIKSGHKVRAHDAILRLKKPLAQTLGKQYHMGIRKINAKKYTVIIPTGKEGYFIDKNVSNDLEQITDFQINKNNVTIVMENMTESDLRKHVTNRVLNYITKEESEKTEDDEPSDILTRQVTKIEPGTITGHSPEFKPLFTDDPTEECMKQGWVKKFPGRGQWFYGPEIVTLYRALEKTLVEEVVEKLDFQECLFPKLIPMDIIQKMRYFEGLPEGMYYCSAPKREPETFKKFKNELIINKEIPIDLLNEGLKDPSYVLAPAQCEAFYEFLGHEVIEETSLPIKFYDKSGWTYRWEAGGAKGLDRVHEFQRIEMVWAASPDLTNNIRDQTLELSEKLATKLELEWYTEIGDDPFYLEGRKVENRGIEFPDVPKYEMRLALPGKDKGVAVVSANVHGTHFVEGFSIKTSHNSKLWTGCTGLGLTRWLIGFLAQKGFNKEEWPDSIKSKVKEVKVPKILTWP